MEAGKVDLMKKFGRRDINRHDVFATAPDSTEFLRAYAWNENKSIKKEIHSGHVTLNKERPTKSDNTKLAFCPEKAWLVSDLELVHSPSCDAVRKCSKKLLMELPGFKRSMVKGLSTARAWVAASVKATDDVNVDHRPALVYGAISRAKALMEEEEDNYDKLPAFLRSFARKNPGSTFHESVHFYKLRQLRHLDFAQQDSEETEERAAPSMSLIQALKVALKTPKEFLARLKLVRKDLKARSKLAIEAPKTSKGPTGRLG
ncbi:hypothetical protein PHYSODRAFT_339468 [Phytophthora sojae]|uniref:Uncharacterized protein n=1 Tax=Phytophthora sojae (strain P6497) TaxID=1094619 RepID=G5A6Y3_PHYSP|nr:hypothetical protein PHYSODRAFT_339468 [Phytophthora sojae]EGZ09088.1 hypothetical protein PHYSODRAFT_339468 [Phytophthora sojae]|eukprot:XP_009535721.1 hypothetical protein PHYSODRAFT_339468 [Phytophthora sojae]